MTEETLHDRTRHSSKTPLDWIARWQRIARRIRVPLGFLTAALYLFELWRRAPMPAAVAWSLALVLPGLWLRAYAAGYVKKNRELTLTGPYAHTRNPLYLGSMLIAAGFAVALLSWPVALVLAAGLPSSTSPSSPPRSASSAPPSPSSMTTAAAFPAWFRALLRPHRPEAMAPPAASPLRSTSSTASTMLL